MANVEYEVKGKLAYITLNRPEKLNAITLPMFDEIVSTCRRYNEDPDVWVAILSGKGRAFCPGIDLTEQKPGLTFNVDEVYFSILGVKKPLIAAVHGYCLAQGAGIAFCCDIRVAAEGTKFGWPQVKRGMSSISGPSFAAHHLPLNYAYEYLFTGELFDAQEAYRFNLINRVVPQDKLMSAAEEIAGKILNNAPLAVQGMKEAAQMGLELPLPQRMHSAQLILNRIKHTKDFQEGILAFKEKREPVWRGE
ncbi:Enoyl-CoA-hydratase [subsurface metagenome]